MLCNDNKKCGVRAGKGLRTSVDHHVHAGLREDGHLARCECLLDNSGTIFGNHICVGRALDCDDVVACTRVIVWWKH